MASPDLSVITTSFVELGGGIFRKRVLGWNLGANGIQVRTNVKTPQALTKLSAVGGPRPYRSQDDTAGNGAKFTDRVLNVYQSKWDYDFDPEEFRNTYLANAPETPFVQAANDQVASEYLQYLRLSVLGKGVRNAGGSTPADLANGWLTIISNEITATKITPVATGVITAANAVDKVEIIAEGVPVWMRENGFRIYCSYGVLDMYKKHYRATYGYNFDKSETGQYKLDGINAVLTPMAEWGTSQRLVATVDNNLVAGTDLDNVEVHATQRRNIIEIRQMMPIGTEIQDLEALGAVSDQA